MKCTLSSFFTLHSPFTTLDWPRSVVRFFLLFIQLNSCFLSNALQLSWMEKRKRRTTPLHLRPLTREPTSWVCTWHAIPRCCVVRKGRKGRMKRGKWSARSLHFLPFTSLSHITTGMVWRKEQRNEWRKHALTSHHLSFFTLTLFFLHSITLHFKSFLVLHSSFPLALFICNGTQVKHEMNKAKEERETEPGTVCALFLLCSLGLFRASLSYHYK